jgi:hypothetical protein
MSVTYTNRKGVTYYLCRSVTKTGKPRYVFAREPKGEPVDRIPDGYTISESVNGVVSLVKDRPTQLLPEEVATVEAAVARHPKRRNYRVNVWPERIEVYELVGTDPQELVAALDHMGLLFGGAADRVDATLDRHAQFTPVMRFTLVDAEQRAFRAERMCYRGSIDDWINIDYGPMDRLARKLIPTLGTDEFFELF